MDILEYRAMVAQEKAQADSTQQGSGEQPNVQTQQSSTEPIQSTNQTAQQTQSTPTNVEGEGATQVKSDEPKPTVLDTVEVDGKQVPIEELKKGYLRQSDYTRKTQEVSRQMRQAQEALAIADQLKTNPELAKQLNYDPVEAERKMLEAERYDLMLQQEVNLLSTKYADFDVQEVLDFALSRQMSNLEDAYLLNKTLKPSVPSQSHTQPAPQVDVEAIKAQLRAELRAELEAEQNTSTIISTTQGSAPRTPQTPQISESEMRIARMMNLTNEEYVKWRDIN